MAATPFRIRTLNSISPRGLERLPGDRYRSSRTSPSPTRSWCARRTCTRSTIPGSVKAIGRAGAGTNNIPVAAMSQARRAGVQRAGRQRQRGQGARASPAMLLAARNIVPALALRRAVSTAPTIATSTRRSRRARRSSSASSCPDRTLGVIGLGAIGVPGRRRGASRSAWTCSVTTRSITVDARLELPSQRGAHGASLDDAVRARRLRHAARAAGRRRRATWSTRRDSALMRAGGRSAQLRARRRSSTTRAIVAALDGGELAGYVCDFPDARASRTIRRSSRCRTSAPRRTRRKRTAP